MNYDSEPLPQDLTLHKDTYDDALSGGDWHVLCTVMLCAVTVLALLAIGFFAGFAYARGLL